MKFLSLPITATIMTVATACITPSPRLPVAVNPNSAVAPAFDSYAATTTSPRLAIPADPISAIVAAFDSFPVVALDEGFHRNEQGHAFRLSLIRDTRFSAVVDDIVVEFGNARYQDLMDRFISGEDVPEPDLRQVWQNTTQSHDIWDVPIYEEFFRAVRAVNASHSGERQLRVLLGDPPIDWDSVRSPEDYKILDRDGHPVEIIKREVIAKKRRALVIYGGGHLLRKSPGSIVNLLEGLGNVKVFAIYTQTNGADLTLLQPEIASWNVPSLTMLHGTVLGLEDFLFFLTGKVEKNGDSKPIENEFDALLYLGPPSTITFSEIPVKLCSDQTYIEMRTRRTVLSSFDNSWAEKFKQHCGTKLEL